MTIVTAINRGYHRVSASVGASWWSRLEEIAKEEVDGMAYPPDYLYDLSPSEIAHEKRLVFRRELASLERDSRLDLLAQLNQYNQANDKDGHILKILVLENRASRFRGKVDIYERWRVMESGLQWQARVGYIDEVVENLHRALSSLKKFEGELTALKKELKEANVGLGAEMVGEDSQDPEDQ